MIKLKTLLAFHNDPAVQTKFRNRVLAHQRADQIVQGYGYFKDGKGCAVGCTLDSNDGDHSAYERELGIPTVLARLEDRIFENLPKKEARTWPARFLAAPKVGADLGLVAHHFAIWLLTSPDSLYTKVVKEESDKKVLSDVAELYSRFIAGDKPTEKQWAEVEARAREAITLAWNKYLDLDRALARALARAVALARALDLDLGLDLARARDLDCALALDLGLGLDRAVALALDLAQKFFVLAAENLLLLMSEAPVVAKAKAL